MPRPRKSKTQAPAEAAPAAAIAVEVPAGTKQKKFEIPATSRPLTPKEGLRCIVKSFYSVQKERIRNGNRISAQWKRKLGIESGEKEDDRAAQDKLTAKILDCLRTDFKKITDGLKAMNNGKKTKDLVTPETFKATPLFTTWTEALMFQLYMDLEAHEERMKNQIIHYLPPFRIYDQFLSKVVGIGPCSAGILLSWLDVNKATHVSDFWKYCGLAVRQDVDGKADSMREEHLELVKYIDKDGVEKTKKSIRWVPFMKSKCLTVIGDSLIRARNLRYRTLYDEYRYRLDAQAENKTGNWANSTKGHRHYAARRRMVKLFLKDLWMIWRQLEGLPVSQSYEEWKLGITHSAVIDITLAFRKMDKAKSVAEATDTEEDMAADEAAEVDPAGPDVG